MITRLRIAASRDEIFTNNTILSISEKRGGSGVTQSILGDSNPSETKWNEGKAKAWLIILKHPFNSQNHKVPSAIGASRLIIIEAIF